MWVPQFRGGWGRRPLGKSMFLEAQKDAWRVRGRWSAKACPGPGERKRGEGSTFSQPKNKPTSYEVPEGEKSRVLRSTKSWYQRQDGTLGLGQWGNALLLRLGPHRPGWTPMQQGKIFHSRSLACPSGGDPRGIGGCGCLDELTIPGRFASNQAAAPIGRTPGPSPERDGRRRTGRLSLAGQFAKFSTCSVVGRELRRSFFLSVWELTTVGTLPGLIHSKRSCSIPSVAFFFFRCNGLLTIPAR